jgi:hypothetical protein
VEDNLTMAHAVVASNSWLTRLSETTAQCPVTRVIRTLKPPPNRFLTGRDAINVDKRLQRCEVWAREEAL